MAQNRVSKHISNPKDVEYILSITPEQARLKSTIMDLFADFGSGPRFNTYDTITIPKGSYGQTKKNKNDFTTTVGLYIYNKGSIEYMADVLGYINKPVSKKTWNEINKKISYAKLEDKISMQDMKDFILQTQIYMSCASALSPSHTMKLLLATTELEKKKKELMKKYAKELEEKDIVGINKMEKELLDYAAEYMGDDPSMDMYNSGARSTWGNNFKNMYAMKGAIQLSDGSYDVVTSSYISGLNKEDFVKTNDSSVSGPYSRAVNTATGGYKEKLAISAYQHIVTKYNTDCGTTKTIKVHLDKSNIEDWMYCYIKTGNNTYTELTSDNIDRFIDKDVQIRFAALCESKKYICEKCAGTLFKRLEIENIGLTTAQIFSTLKNASMKNFHNSTISLHEIDVNKVF